MEENINVIIVDDHKICRVGLEMLLEEIENVTILGQASSGDELFRLLKKHDPDIIFMDLNLGTEKGSDITRKVLAKQKNTYVIACTSSDELSSFLEMMEAGASAFLLKNVTEDEIQLAITEVINGKNYFSKEFMSFAKNFYKKPRQRNTKIKLTEKEEEVLQLICSGYSNNEIAETMNLSHHTIDTHRRNLFNKTGAKNAASLVMIALQEGLVSLDS